MSNVREFSEGSRSSTVLVTFYSTQMDRLDDGQCSSRNSGAIKQWWPSQREVESAPTSTEEKIVHHFDCDKKLHSHSITTRIH